MGGAIPGASGTSISASRLTCSVPEVTGAATPVMDRPEPTGPPVSFGPPQTSGRAQTIKESRLGTNDFEELPDVSKSDNVYVGEV